LAGLSEKELEITLFDEIAAYEQAMVSAAIDAYTKSKGDKVLFDLEKWRVEAGILIRGRWQQSPAVQELYGIYRRTGVTDSDTLIHILELGVQSAVNAAGSELSDDDKVKFVTQLNPDAVATTIMRSGLFSVRGERTGPDLKKIGKSVLTVQVAMLFIPVVGQILLARNIANAVVGKDETAIVGAVHILLSQRISLIGLGTDIPSP